MAASLGCSFGRIQFTPDLLPSDVTGVSIYNQKTGEFEFRAGPVMAQVILADEINRATPRTQSALLEAMQERQVTVDGHSYALPRPFIVLATQNPIELEGTFPLPEAQIDRFLMRLDIGYPAAEEEHAMLLRYSHADPFAELGAVSSPEELVTHQEDVQQVRVEASVRGYIVDIARATRQSDDLQLGVSPRGTLALYRSAQAYAAVRGRTFVLPDDVKLLAPYVLSHRVLVSPSTRLRGRLLAEVLMDVVDSVPVPVDID
jgi:MoxR-like ATPase